MIKQIITFYFLLNLLLGLPQDSNDDDWDIVQKKKFWIGYLESDFPWCRGETVVDWWGVTGRVPNCWVMTEANHKIFFCTNEHIL